MTSLRAVVLAALGWSALAALTYPIEVPFGFSTKGLDFAADGSTSRNLNSAQHIAALQLGVKQASDWIAATAVKLGLPNPPLKLKPRVYQGNQMSQDVIHNEFFDGAFGGYVLGSDVIGVISVDESLSTSRSMVQSFAGWGVSSFLVGQMNSEFSHASAYPLKARIVPSDSFQSVLLVSILQSYHWDRVAVIWSSDQIGIDLHTNFIRTLGTSTITGKTKSAVSVLIDLEVSISETDHSAQIHAAKASGATIFVLLMGASMQASVLKQGYTLGLWTTATQTIGATISTDEAEYGGKSVDAHLAAGGSTAAEIQAILQGHMLLTFEPRVFFLTEHGQNFLKTFKNPTINKPTYKPGAGAGGFAPNTRTFIRSPPYNFVPPYAINEDWFVNECYVWDEDNQEYFPDAVDSRSLPPGAKPGYTVGAMPGSPGLLYASIDGGGKRDPFTINPSLQPTTSNPNAWYWGLIQYQCASSTNNQACRYLQGGENCGGNYISSSGITGCGTLPFDEKPVPVWGTCLGLSATDLSSIPDDGSSVIDWKTLYIMDAMAVVAKYSLSFLASNLATFANNADYVKRLRSYFNTVILSNRKAGQSASTPALLFHTGNASFHAGFASEDSFMLGDRISGFPYSLRNFRPPASAGGSVKWLPAGYYDPQSLAYTACDENGGGTVTILSTKVPCSAAQYRTPGNTIPQSMRPTHVVTPSPAYKSAMQFFGALGLILATVASVGLIAYWNHHTLKLRQQTVLAFIVGALLLATIKVLLSSVWVITEASCHVDYWLTHVSFRIINNSLLFKLWRVDKIFNASGFKRVRITETRIVLNILFSTFMLALVLALESGLGGKRVEDQRVIIDNQLHIIYFCSIPNNPASMVLHALIIIFQALGMLGALYYAWRTKDVPPIVNEAPVIIPMMLVLTLVVIVAFALLYVYDPKPIDYQLVVNLLYGLIACLGTLFYFGDVFWAVRQHDLKNVEGENRRASLVVGGTSGGTAATNTLSTAETVRADDVSNKGTGGTGGGGVGGSLSRRHSLPNDVDISLLHEDLAQELLRQAKGVDRKAMLCQEKIVYWRAMMLRVEEQAEDASGSGTSRASSSPSSSAVYITAEEDDPESLARESAAIAKGIDGAS